MKNLNLILLLLGFLILNSCTQKYNIEAKIEGLKNDTIIVDYGTLPNYFNGKEKRDTIYAKNGVFKYNIPTQEPYFVYFYPIQNEYKRLSGQSYFPRYNYVVTLVKPNDKINITGKLHDYFVDYKAIGSTFNEQYSELRSNYIQESSMAAKLELKIDSLMFFNGDKDEINKLFKTRNTYNRLSRKAELEYIKRHPQENISAFFLTSQSTKIFNQYYPNMPEHVKNGIFKSGLDSKAHKILRTEQINNAKLNLVEGVPAPNFTLMNKYDKLVELNTIDKKYIVLDFWGTWCPPCIKGFPKMKTYYSKYKKDIAFVGIACNDEKDKWKAAIKKYDINWIQLFNNDEFDYDVSLKYGVTAYPTKVIINSEKKIVSIFTDEGDDFYNKLDELMN